MNRGGGEGIQTQNKIIFINIPQDAAHNESFVWKARCVKPPQVPLLCAAKLISIIINTSVCLA